MGEVIFVLVIVGLFILLAVQHDTHKSEPEPETKPEPEPVAVPSPRERLSTGLVTIDEYTHFKHQTVCNNVTFSGSRDYLIPRLKLEHLSGADEAMYTLDFSSGPWSIDLRNLSNLSISSRLNLPYSDVKIDTANCTSLWLISEGPGTPLQTGSIGVTINSSKFIDAHIIGNNTCLDCADSQFHQLEVVGPDITKFIQCYVLDGKLVSENSSTILYANSCQFKNLDISGPYRRITFISSDLSGVSISGDIRSAMVHKCIGNGTTIQHLIVKNLFINWTSTKIFMTAIATYTTAEWLITDLDKIAQFLSGCGYASDIGWIIDYILDHPAAPFTD